jgi:hypothetical protein
MSWTFVVVYAHLVGAVLFVGYFLFWALLTSATWREFSGSGAEQLLRAARAAAWPFPGYKPNLALIGWLLLAFVVASGVLLIMSGASVPGSFSTLTIHVLRVVKALLLVALVVCMPRLGASRARLASFSLVLVLLIVAISAQLIR